MGYRPVPVAIPPVAKIPHLTVYGVEDIGRAGLQIEVFSERRQSDTEVRGQQVGD